MTFVEHLEDNKMRIPRPSHFIGVICIFIENIFLHVRYNQRTIDSYFRKKGAKIGKGCHIKVHSLGQEPYLVRIGNHVFIAEGVVFLTHDGGVWIFREEVDDLQFFGPIVIEDNCLIGRNTVLLPNIRIGKNSIVQPGSVVISDIPSESVVMGVPARVISSIFEYKNKYINGWMEQKPPDSCIEGDSNWWTSKHLKENKKKLRRHLINIFNRQLQVEEEAGTKSLIK